MAKMPYNFKCRCGSEWFFIVWNPPYGIEYHCYNCDTVYPWEVPEGDLKNQEMEAKYAGGKEDTQAI